MRLNFNISSLVAKNALAKNDARLADSTLRLSSGYKINKASDNAAGLAIARKMNFQIKGILRANQNANDGISVVNTADGAMMEMHDILQRMNELSIQAANGTNSDDDRAKIQLEIDQLISELDRIADTTQFNSQTLLDGTFSYKGYTNTENVRVMSSTDGVTAGKYAIGTVSCTYTEKKITTYINPHKIVEEVDLAQAYDLGKADDIRNALVFEDDLNTYDTDRSKGLRAFPKDSLVTIEDEYIVIKASGDFEVKLAVNNNDAITGAGLAVTKTEPSVSMISTYNQILVKADNGKVYSAGGIKLEEKLDTDGNPVPGTSHVYPVPGTSQHLNEGYADVAASLQKFFDDEKLTHVTVTGVNASKDANTFSITIDSDQGKGKIFDFEINGGAALQEFLYKTEEERGTKYTIGSNDPADCITVDITGRGPMRVQVGANEGQYLDIEIPDLNTLYLGVDKLNVRTEAAATESINIVGKAIDYLSGVRAKIGAYTNRLEHTVKNLEMTEENMTASYSRIMDVDMAKEMVDYTTRQVLVQASNSMLAQANERPQQVLQLIQ